jgi:hypothetical protein
LLRDLLSRLKNISREKVREREGGEQEEEYVRPG